MRRRRSVAFPLAALLSLLLLSACTGDGAAAGFEAAFADDPAVASLELTSRDNHAFTGGVSGEVIADDRVTEDQWAALVDRVSAYTAAHAEAMGGRVSVVGSGLSLLVTGAGAEDAAAARLLLALRAEPGFASADLTSERGTHVAVRTIATEDALAIASRIPERARAAGVALPPTVRVRTVDEATDLDALSASELADVTATWAAVSAEVPAVGIRSDGTAMTLALASEADLERAETAARPVAAALPVRFASDTVRLGDADGEIARAFWAALDPADRDGVQFVWESDRALQVMAVDAAAVPGLVAPVRRAASGRAQSVELRADGPPHVTVDLALVTDADASSTALARLIADEEVVSVFATPRSITVAVASGDDIARLAAPSRMLAPAGSRVCVDRERDAVCVTAADRLDRADARGNARAFVDAWNAEAMAP